MGVLPCWRGNCDNIMCDRYSSKYGYICFDCYEELCSTTPASIKEFMDSDPIDKNEIPTVDYNKIFKHRRDRDHDADDDWETV